MITNFFNQININAEFKQSYFCKFTKSFHLFFLIFFIIFFKSSFHFSLILVSINYLDYYYQVSKEQHT